MSDSANTWFSFDDGRLVVSREITIERLPELMRVLLTHRTPIREVYFNQVTVLDSAAIVVLLACRRTIDEALTIRGASERLGALIRLYRLETLFLQV